MIEGPVPIFPSKKFTHPYVFCQLDLSQGKCYEWGLPETGSKAAIKFVWGYDDSVWLMRY